MIDDDDHDHDDDDDDDDDDLSYHNDSLYVGKTMFQNSGDWEWSKYNL